MAELEEFYINLEFVNTNLGTSETFVNFPYWVEKLNTNLGCTSIVLN